MCARLQAVLGHPVIGPLERPGRVDDQERPVDRPPQRLAIVAAPRRGTRPRSGARSCRRSRVAAHDADPAARVARQRLGDPAAEDPVAPQDADDPRRVAHSGSIHPSYRTSSPRNGAKTWTTTTPAGVAGIDIAHDRGRQPARDRDAGEPGPTELIPQPTTRRTPARQENEIDPKASIKGPPRPLDRLDAMPVEVPDPSLPIALDLDLQPDRHVRPARGIPSSDAIRCATGPAARSTRNVPRARPPPLRRGTAGAPAAGRRTARQDATVQRRKSSHEWPPHDEQKGTGATPTQGGFTA